MYKSSQKSESQESRMLEPHILYTNEFITGAKLPFRIGTNVSIEQYNRYLDDLESSGFKLKREDNGDVFVIDMSSCERAAARGYLDACFSSANGANPLHRQPIWSSGASFHESPTYRYYLQPCCSFAPDELLVKTCPRSGYPGPPPSDPNGNPYARVICEIGHFRSTTSLWEMCEDWIRQPYVRYVIGIKFHDKKTTKNELGQLHRAMTARVYCQPGAPQPTPLPLAPHAPPVVVPGPIPLVPGVVIPRAAPPPRPLFFEWEFGTHYSGVVNIPTTCTALDLPAFQIQLPTSEIFWDPPLPAPPVIPVVPTGYMATIPATLITAGFSPIAPMINIDLYRIQQLTLKRQDNSI